MRKRKRLLGLLVVVTLMAGLLPLTAMATQPKPQEPVCSTIVTEPVMTRDWVRYKIQKSVWETGKAYNDGQGPGAAYWVGTNNSVLVTHDPLVVNLKALGHDGGPLGDGYRRVGTQAQDANATRFNSSWDYSATGTYFYKLIDTQNKSQLDKPAGDGWIDLGLREEVEGSTRHTEGCEVTFSVAQSCGGIEVTLTSNVARRFGNQNQNPYYYGMKMSGNGQNAQVIGNSIDDGPFSKKMSLSFAEDANGGEVEVNLTWWAHTEQSWIIVPDEFKPFVPASGIQASFTVDTNCKDDLLANPTFEVGNESAVCNPETGEFENQANGFITLNPGDNYTWTTGASQTGLSAGEYGPYKATAADGFTFESGKTFSTGAITILLEKDQEDCDKLTEPESPVVNESEACEVNDSFAIPDTEGVVYLVNGEEAKAGTVFNTPGDYTVTAKAEDGYELTDPEWSVVITLEAGEPCPSTTTSTTTPEETTTSTTLPPVTTTTPTTERSLPFTGIGDFYLPTAIALVAAGGLLLALSRRPEEDVA